MSIEETWLYLLSTLYPTLVTIVPTVFPGRVILVLRTSAFHSEFYTLIFYTLFIENEWSYSAHILGVFPPHQYLACVLLAPRYATLFLRLTHHKSLHPFSAGNWDLPETRRSCGGFADWVFLWDFSLYSHETIPDRMRWEDSVSSAFPDFCVHRDRSARYSTHFSI